MSTCIVCGRERNSDTDDVHWLHEPDCKEPGNGCDCDVVACEVHCPSCAGDDAEAEMAELVNKAYAAMRSIAHVYFKEVVQPWLDSNGGLGLMMVNGEMVVSAPFGKGICEGPGWMTEEFNKVWLGVKFGNMMPTYLPWVGSVNNLDISRTE